MSLPRIDGTPHHRRESAAKKEIGPLLTNAPLPRVREKRPAAQPQRKRKRVLPTKQALSFDPKRSPIPSGRQDPPMPSPVGSRPSASESSTSSYDEQQTTPFPDREFYEHDAQKRPRIFSDCPPVEHSTSYYPDSPCTDANDMSSVPPELYDSPVSYTSSSSPAPSDQSACAAEFVHIDYAHQVQAPLSMYPFGGQVYVQQPVIHQDSYGYPVEPCPDRPPQGYPVQHIDAAYGRAVPHGVQGYPENNGYQYPARRY